MRATLCLKGNRRLTAAMGLPRLLSANWRDAQVEKGSDIFISVWNIHRDSEHWERPNEFDPSRFDASRGTPNEATENFAYLPFGGGRRKCIGGV